LAFEPAILFYLLTAQPALTPDLTAFSFPPVHFAGYQSFSVSRQTGFVLILYIFV
jgi:hypothetical protein